MDEITTEAELRELIGEPATWDAEALPTPAEITHAQDAPATALAGLEQYYGEQYAADLYPTV